MIFNAIKIKEIIKNKIKEEGRKSINFFKNKMEHYFLSGVIKKIDHRCQIPYYLIINSSS